MKPHKHAELIKAWADGAEIECRNKNTQEFWVLAHTPSWDLNWLEFRIKPEPKPDVVRYVTYEWNPENQNTVGGIPCNTKGKFANLKLVFDGETGELKSAEVL